VIQACDVYLQMMKGLPLEYAKPTLIKFLVSKIKASLSF
jgi:hypothetical protein